MPLTTYIAGEVLTAASLNANFSFASTNAGPIAIFNETQASGTNGGGFTSGSFLKRTLNTTVVNQITGCTLTSSVISLPAGTYLVLALAPGNFVNSHKIRLQNTTASSTIAIGANSIAARDASIMNTSQLQTSFVLTTTSNIELQHRCATTNATDGFGVSNSFGVDEIYSQITITKIA